ncbi:PAS domain S-box protein [Thioalkalicoccus limnaeus]|uniref:histidine kinase n=1 Tax=Thioalkalicoccus limnaeus TaxID=120681 RepID=A0ABV4BFF1_9GAMM
MKTSDDDRLVPSPPLRPRRQQTFAVGPRGALVADTIHQVREQIEQALRHIALGVCAASGDSLFQTIVNSLAETLGVDMAFISELPAGCETHVGTRAVSDRGLTVPNLEFELAGTPCLKVLNEGFQFIGDDLSRRFPVENMLSGFGFVAYAGYPLVDSAGRAIGLVALLHRAPLTDAGLIEAVLQIYSVRVAAELDRQRSEASYRAIFEAAEDAIFVHDLATGAILDVNPAACRTYGYSHKEMLHLNPGHLSSGIPPYDLEGAARWIGLASAGEPQRFEWHRRNADGSLHWDEVTLKRATLGGIDRLIAITREITERKRAEETLRATFEAALDPIIGMDDAGQVIAFNPAAEQTFGYRRAEVIGRSLAELIVPERFREAHRLGMVRYHRDGHGPMLGQRVEVIACRADGSELPVEVAIDQAQGPEGTFFVGYLRNITERKLAEEEHARLESQFRQAQKMEAIGHLAGGIAHDFNNILTGAMGYVTLAQELTRDHGDSRLDRYLDRAQRAGLRARDLIQQLLTFSRGQRGDPRPLELAPLVRETLRFLGATLGSEVEIVTHLPPDLPQVNLDPVQVEQILINLCINARDAMSGSGRLEIGLARESLAGTVCASCKQRVRGDHLVLWVRDTGSGIAPRHLDRLFEPFFTTKPSGQGSGMGLAVVHGVVHEYGGHLCVASTPHQGTLIRVLFPPMHTTNPLVAEPASAKPRPTAAPARRYGRVLLVDDDDLAGGLMLDLLEDRGLDVILVTNGEEALATLSSAPESVDLLITDQAMPRMTGMDLAQRVHPTHPDLPILLYTGNAEALDAEEMGSAGVRALIRKPVDVAVLDDWLQELLPPADTRAAMLPPPPSPTSTMRP